MNQEERTEKAEQLIKDLKADNMKIDEVSKLLCRAYSLVRKSMPPTEKKVKKAPEKKA
jgi:hypothetical protein